MKSLASRLALAFASLALLLNFPRANAQTVLEMDGTSATIFETDGPPSGCGYPTGPIVGSFSYVAPFSCPTAAPVVGDAFAGDVASDHFSDTVWVTDGLRFTEYAGSGEARGTPLRSFELPLGLVLDGRVTGMDFVGSLGQPGYLLVTDGRLCAGIAPPATPGCALPTVVVAPFALPWPGFATDLAWQGLTNSIWVCDDLGFTSEVYLGGGAGASGSFPAGCGLVPPLTGIAADPGFPIFVLPALYVTDGVTVSRVSVNGSPAFPQMHSPFPCFPISAATVNGLGSTSHPIAYGIGTDGAGGPGPVMTSTGQMCQPSGPITFTLSGADPTPGTLCILIYQLASLCPPATVLGGNSLYVAPGNPSFGPFAVVGGSCSITFTITGSASFPVLPTFLQWIVAKGSGGFQASNALSFIGGFP